MSTVQLLVLLGTGLVGALGWVAAYFARGATNDVKDALAKATAGTVAAQQAAFSAAARATSAEAQLAAEQSKSSALAKELDLERAGRQSLVDELAKSGAPVGPVVVDSALDSLFQGSGGQGAGADPGNNPATVPGVPADAPTKAPKGR